MVKLVSSDTGWHIQAVFRTNGWEEPVGPCERSKSGKRPKNGPEPGSAIVAGHLNLARGDATFVGGSTSAGYPKR